MALPDSDFNQMRAENAKAEAARLAAQNKNAQQSVASQVPNQTQAYRNAREEDIGKRPKVGSNALDRAGGTAGYTPGLGFQSKQNSTASQAIHDQMFPLPPQADPHAGVPPTLPPGASVSAPLNVGADARGTNPFYVRGAHNAPGTPAFQGPNVWTGPSLLPKLGPPAAEPWRPTQGNFVVPAPLTGPNGTPASDAAELAANAAMAAPGGANGFWQSNTPSAAPSGKTEFAPDPGLSSLPSGAQAQVPYGTVGHILPPAPPQVQGPPGPSRQRISVQPKNPEDEAAARSAATSEAPQMNAYA